MPKHTFSEKSGQPERVGRPGRRPSNKPRNICVTISLPPEMHDSLRRLGGSRWVQEKIREAERDLEEGSKEGSE